VCELGDYGARAGGSRLSCQRDFECATLGGGGLL
jgi:hypothetical protein